MLCGCVYFLLQLTDLITDINFKYFIYRLDLVCATGFISVIAAIVFLVDLILTVRSGSRGDLGD